jgi:hypothetical protein
MTLNDCWRSWKSYLLNPVGDALLRRKASSPSFQKHAEAFPGAVAEAMEAAERAGAAGFQIDSGWQRRHCLTGAVDRQDNMARLFRHDLTRREILDVHGEWPAGRFVALGLHWGAGFPALAHLEQSGRSPAFVYQPEDVETLGSLPARLYDRLHLKALRSFDNCIRVGGAYRAIADAVDSGFVPIVLVDAPGSETSSTVNIQRAAFQVRLRSGVFRLLAEKKVDVVYFRSGYLPASCRRFLEIGEPLRVTSMEAVAEASADFLLSTLEIDSAQWHFWTMGAGVIRTDQNDSNE